MNINNQLIKLGFSEKEADVYLACLQLGEALITDIADAAKIKRPTTYNIIEALIKKGAIQKNETSTRTYYLAQPPNQLLKTFERTKNEFEKSIPELNAIYNLQKGAPQIKYYEGVRAIKEVYAKLIRKKENGLLFITPIKEYKQKYPDLFQSHNKLIKLSKGKERKLTGRYSCVQILTNDKKILISWKRNVTAIEIRSTNIVELDRYLFHVEQ